MSSQYYNPTSSSGGGTNQNDLLKGQFQNTNLSPEMLNYGLSAGQDIINRQRAKFMPGFSDFWCSLKIYFAVSNSYVLQKLAIILYPMKKNMIWGRIPADEAGRIGDDSELYSTHKWALPRQDVNAPDLYIPLMSFITYVLLVGFRKGMGGTGFTPEVLIQSVWRCLILQICETVIIKFGLSVMQVPMAFLDVFAYTGYKYIGLCINTTARLFGSGVSFMVALYTCGTLAFFILKAMAAVVPATVSTGPPRHLMLLGFAGLQFVVSFIMYTL
mmetsp:Transcript_34916/g.33211  ORF Transcript_34916/g.33211 Transcript_34916/m.33211 type:complete len:272 (-) Transcript_34916:74-889(-)